MLYSLARLLQFVGLVLLPIALAGNVAEPDRVDLRTMLMLAGAGIGVFALGWLLQQAVRSK